MPKKEKKTHPLIDQAIEKGMRGEPPDAQIYRPQKINGKEMREIAVVRRQPVPEIRDHIIRIQQEADPIGFLMAVVQGMAFETHFVDEEGRIVTIYEYPNLEARMKTARYLADKIMPRLAVVKHIIPDQNPDNPSGTREITGNRSWAQIVEEAAKDG